MMSFEKLAEYKRALKTFVRGAIKSKILVNDQGQLKLNIYKETIDKTEKHVVVEIANDAYTAIFYADVSTRIFNKFEPALFEPIQKQFNKLKGFGGIVVEESEEGCCCDCEEE